MGIRSEIDVEEGRVFSRASGVVTAEEIAGHQRDLVADRRFDPRYDHLFDLRDSERIELSTAEIRELSRVRVFAETSRLAVVAGSDAAFGLSRMYEGFGRLEENRFRVFRTLADAEAWLSERPSGRG